VPSSSSNKVNTKAVLASLSKYEKEAKKEWGKVVRGSIKRYAENLAYRTQPFGDRQSAQLKGIIFRTFI